MSMRSYRRTHRSAAEPAVGGTHRVADQRRTLVVMCGYQDVRRAQTRRCTSPEVVRG
jgi:hypothetical protein